MRSELDVLLDKVEDPALRADPRAQIERIQAKRTIGLVFESHLPERSITKTKDGTLRTLDLLDEKVRDSVHRFDGAKVTALYESDLATEYQ